MIVDHLSIALLGWSQPHCPSIHLMRKCLLDLGIKMPNLMKIMSWSLHFDLATFIKIRRHYILWVAGKG